MNAEVPLAEMFGYATAIRSLSKGRASYSMEPLRSSRCRRSVEKAILDTAAKRPAARTFRLHETDRVLHSARPACPAPQANPPSYLLNRKFVTS